MCHLEVPYSLLTFFGATSSTHLKGEVNHFSQLKISVFLFWALDTFKIEPQQSSVQSWSWWNTGSPNHNVTTNNEWQAHCSIVEGHIVHDCCFLSLQAKTRYSDCDVDIKLSSTEVVCVYCIFVWIFLISRYFIYEIPSGLDFSCNVGI